MDNSKIAICYTCAGPSYRESALNSIVNNYPDNENIVYCILTDDATYFKDLNKKNVVINELTDFYSDYPETRKNEYFIKTNSKDEYGKFFTRDGYRFPFSVMRFQILQAISVGVKNVALLCTDSILDFDLFNKDRDFLLTHTNTISNAVSLWKVPPEEEYIPEIIEVLKEIDYYEPSKEIVVLDGAARFFPFDSLQTQVSFFNIWNKLIEKLYEKGIMNKFKGGYAVNDEYVLAIIYDYMKFNFASLNKDFSHFLKVKHNPKQERYWEYNQI